MSNLKPKGYDAYFSDCPLCCGRDPGCTRCLGVGKVYWAQKIGWAERLGDWWATVDYRYKVLGWFAGVFLAALGVATLLLWFLRGASL
jgi:hypothetical protein